MSQDSKKNSSDTFHPPPPCDPFQRYQTPWPRHGQDDENPFIRFRRFADDQFKSFFSGVPFVKRSLDEHFESLAAQHQKEVDVALNEMIENHRQLVREMERLRVEREEDSAEVMARLCELDRTEKSPGSNTTPKQPNTELELYEGQESPAERLDPFANSDDTYPWLVSSQYSPMYLSQNLKIRPEAFHSSTSTPTGPMMRPNSATEFQLALIPWQQAFEDLLSLERTGQMPSRRPGSLVWVPPCFWLEGLLRKGNLTMPQHLTPRNAALVSAAELHYPFLNGFLKHHSQEEWKEDSDKEELYELDGHDFDEEYDEKEALPEQEPALDTATPGKPLATTLAQAIGAMEKAVEGIMGTTPDDPTPRVSTYSHEEKVSPGSSIVSTMTRTETRTLADGSIETKRVLRRRFADGNEEHEESVETQPATREVPSWLRTRLATADFPTVDKQTQTPEPVEAPAEVKTPSSPEERPRGGGWFWR